MNTVISIFAIAVCFVGLIPTETLGGAVAQYDRVRREAPPVARLVASCSLNNLFSGVTGDQACGRDIKVGNQYGASGGDSGDIDPSMLLLMALSGQNQGFGYGAVGPSYFGGGYYPFGYYPPPTYGGGSGYPY